MLSLFAVLAFVVLKKYNENRGKKQNEKHLWFSYLLIFNTHKKNYVINFCPDLVIYELNSHVNNEKCGGNFV